MTVRQKDPQRSFTALHADTGVKTRHHDSRGSSRTSSRASSPISSQTDSCNRDTLIGTSAYRKIKTRATKVKKVPTPVSSSKTSFPHATGASSADKLEESDLLADKDNVALEHFTFSNDDGTQIQLIYPSSKESPSKTSGAPSVATRPYFCSPRASIVESETEILRTNVPTSRSLDNGGAADKNAKMKLCSKSMKRPRPSQAPVNPAKMAKPSGTSSSSTTKVDESTISKCGKWIDAPHFNSYRTFPSVNSTTSLPVADWSPSSQSSPSSYL